MRFAKVFAVFFLFFSVSYTQATPIDYDGDLLSDPSAVIVNSNLDWVSIIQNQEETILQSFGQAGDHLVPANYLGDGTIPAKLNSDGLWSINDHSDVNFGDATSLFIAGADLDGNNQSDLVYASNACLFKKSKFNVLLNPLSSSQTSTRLKAGKGNYFKFYHDSNNDQLQELCYLVPLRINKQIRNKFRAICRDVHTKQIINKFTVGKVNQQPHPIKVEGQADYILLYTQKNAKTKLKILDQVGKLVKKTTVNQDGTIIIGNFTSANNEQIAIVKDGQAQVYDVITGSLSTISFPDGIPYDEVNVVHFTDNESCFCTSKTIKQNGSCNVSDNSGGGDSGSSKLYIPDNCSNPPEHITNNDGFKCIASATRGGSLVCLLPYQFTWKPHRQVTDHHGYTFGCNKNEKHFDQVKLVLKSGQIIDLNYAGCHNYVATEEGAIGRQHFRNESIKWNDIKNKARTLEMTKDGKQTCLSF